MGKLPGTGVARIASTKVFYAFSLSIAILMSAFFATGCGPGLYYEYRRPVYAADKQPGTNQTRDRREDTSSRDHAESNYDFWERSDSQDDYIDPTRYSPAPITPRVTRNRFGESVEGRALEYHQFGSGQDIVLVFGAIHGDEPASEMLALGLIDWLNDNDMFQPIWDKIG